MQENNMEEDKLKKQIDERVKVLISEYMKSSAFTDRKLTDTPTDANEVVNRRYVTLNGVTANRPRSSVIGQSYLDMTLAAGNGKPIYWNGTGWIDATGAYV